MADHLTVEAVEGVLELRQKGLAFPRWLEARFEQDTRKRRAERLHRTTMRTVVIYNMFLIPDWMLVADTLAVAIALHFAIVTPWILLVGWLVTDRLPRLAREGLIASVPVLIVLQILAVFVLTRSPGADHYQYFVLLTLLFANTVLRLPFVYALAASCAILAAHAAAVVATDHFSGLAGVVAMVTLWVAAYLTLISNYHLERDARRTYLHVLRDRLRHADVEAAARHDALTGLANRHYLNLRLAELWRGNALPRDVAVIMLDIDHFKLYNDRYGHLTGDGCIKRVAACLQAELRSGLDLAVRYGGEELLVLLPDTPLFEAVRIAERVRRSVEALGIPHEGLARHRIVTISAGVAAAPAPHLPSTELIGSADAALYAAKRNGRNQVWPPLLHDSAADHGKRQGLNGSL